MSDMIVTTADLKCEYEVIGPVQYQVSNKGILSSAFSLAKNRYGNALKDMEADCADWAALYGEWGVGHNDFDAAFYVSVQELKERAKKLGADAIIGMRQDIDMDTSDYSSFYIQMYGTAVKFLKEECEAACEPEAEEEPAAVVEEEPAPVFEEPAPAVEEEPAPAVFEEPAPVFEEPAPAVEEETAPVFEEPARFTFEEPAPAVFDPAPLTFEPTPSVYEDTTPIAVEEPEPAPIEIEIPEAKAPAVEPAAPAAAAAPKPFGFCPNCGAPLREGAAFCTNCGTPVSAMGKPAAPAAVPAAAPQAAPADHNSTIELLLKYKSMLDNGEITQEQFEAMKKSIL